MRASGFGVVLHVYLCATLRLNKTRLLPGPPYAPCTQPAPEERHVNSQAPPPNTTSPGGVKQNNFRFWNCSYSLRCFIRVYKTAEFRRVWRRVTQRIILCATLRLTLRSSAVLQNYPDRPARRVQLQRRKPLFNK